MARLRDIQRERMVRTFAELRAICASDEEFYKVLAHKWSREVDTLHDYYMENYTLIRKKYDNRTFS